MLNTRVGMINVSIGNPAEDLGGGQYRFNLYFDPSDATHGSADQLRSRDVLPTNFDFITDRSGNKWNVESFEGSPTSLFINAQKVIVTLRTGTNPPAMSNNYDSTCETPDTPNLLPDVSWECEIRRVQKSVPAYHYLINIGNIVASDPGAYIADLNDLVVDGDGNFYYVVEKWSGDIGDAIKIKEIFETNDAPLENRRAFICRPKPYGSLLTQGLLERLDTPVIRDRVINVNLNWIWRYRGVEITANGSTIGTNVTKLDMTGIVPNLLSGYGWAGGTQANLTGGSGGGGSLLGARYCSTEGTPKTAILPYKNGYIAMICSEASEALFFDRYEASISSEIDIEISDEFTSVCEPGLFPISVVASDGSSIGIEMSDKKITLTRMADISDEPAKVWVVIGGVRSGMGGKFKKMTEAQYRSNEKFWKQAHSGE